MTRKTEHGSRRAQLGPCGARHSRKRACRVERDGRSRRSAQRSPARSTSSPARACRRAITSRRSSGGRYQLSGRLRAEVEPDLRCHAGARQQRRSTRPSRRPSGRRRPCPRRQAARWRSTTSPSPSRSWAADRCRSCRLRKPGRCASIRFRACPAPSSSGAAAASGRRRRQARKSLCRAGQSQRQAEASTVRHVVADFRGRCQACENVLFRGGNRLWSSGFGGSCGC